MPKYCSIANFLFIYLFFRAEFCCLDPADSISPLICGSVLKCARRCTYHTPAHWEEEGHKEDPPSLLGFYQASEICILPLLWSSTGKRLMCRRVNEQLWWCRIVQRTNESSLFRFLSFPDMSESPRQSECMCCCHTSPLVQSTKYRQIQNARVGWQLFFFVFFYHPELA